MARFGLDIALDTNPVIRGGRLAEGLYISDSSGNLTYFGSGTAYEGVTAQATYSVYWFEVDADGNQSAITEQGGNVLSLGENLPILVLGTGTYPSINLVMYRYDSVAFDSAGGDFSYNLSDLSDTAKNTGTISGGAWNETLPLDIVREEIVTAYQGGLTPPEGNYTMTYRITDPNGDTTDSASITNKWAPYVMINGYKVTGSEYVLDVEPPVELAGYDSIDLQYILGGEIATDGSGNPIYGAGGEIGYIGGTLVEELAVSFVKGDNSFIIGNIADSYGNTTSTYPFNATRIPALRYDGLTTVDAETYGTTYDGALSLIVDEGLAEEINVTPEEAPYSFTSGDYRVYNFTGSYTYPATTASNSVPVVIEYKEFAIPPEVIITDPLEGAIITDEDAPGGFIIVTYTINGQEQQDPFIFENGFDDYTITISYTDPATGLTGSDSVNVTYEEAKINSLVHLPMDQIVQDGADFKFIDINGGYDAIVYGAKSIVGGKWVTATGNNDYCYFPSSIGLNWFRPRFSEWSASVVVNFSDATTCRLYGVNPANNSFATGLSLQSVYRMKHGGVTTAFSQDELVGTEQQIGVRVRNVVADWFVDLIVDGLVVDTITMTGTNYNASSPAIICGSFLNDSDPTAGADEPVNGTQRNFRYFDYAVSDADWATIAMKDKE